MFNEEYDSQETKGSGIISLIIGLITFIFMPALGLALFAFILLMKVMKLRFQISTLILMAAFAMTSFLAKTFNVFDFSSLSTSNIGGIVLTYAFICLLLGIFLGWVFIGYKVIELKRYPEMKHIRGWAENFKYAETPMQKIRKKNTAKSLASGLEYDSKRAPIGALDEEMILPDILSEAEKEQIHKKSHSSIVYRHYTEARAHTLLTGATGSGKALHKDTKVPTISGFVSMEDLSIGDIIYNEIGEPTKVIAKYQPIVDDHYRITFTSDGVDIDVLACGDHLWEVQFPTEPVRTIETRMLKELIDRGMGIQVSAASLPRELKSKYNLSSFNLRSTPWSFVHKVKKIEAINSTPEDYYCITVDSPSQLYLITEHFIPTHNTVTMLNLIYNDILSGYPITVIDFKKSPDFVYFLSKWAKENDRPFYHFIGGPMGSYANPFGNFQSTYDPLSSGNPTAKADMILNMRTWDSSSEVFKKRTQDILQSIFYLLDRTPHEKIPGIEWDKGGLAQFVSALKITNLTAMIEVMNEENERGLLQGGDIRRLAALTELYHELTEKRTSDLKNQINELLSIARTLIVSNYGDWLAKNDTHKHIDLYDIATSEEGAIVLFSFSPQEESDFARYVGSIVMSDLSRVSALKNAKGNKTLYGVYIDEFQTLDPDSVKDSLEKSRSANFFITLSLQSLDQVIKAAAKDGIATLNSILDTVANFIFHDGSGYETAERMSKIVGKATRVTYKATSRLNNSFWSPLTALWQSNKKAIISKDTEDDWLVPPSAFQSLQSPKKSNKFKSTAYVINKQVDDDRFQRFGGALARKTHVIVTEEIALGVPSEFLKSIETMMAMSDEENKQLSKDRLASYHQELRDEYEDLDDWAITSIDTNNATTSEQVHFNYEATDALFDNLDSTAQSLPKLAPVDNGNKGKLGTKKKTSFDDFKKKANTEPVKENTKKASEPRDEHDILPRL